MNADPQQKLWHAHPIKTQLQILIKIAAAAEIMDAVAVAVTDVWRKIYCNLCVLSIYSETHAARNTYMHRRSLPQQKNDKKPRPKDPKGNVKKRFDTHQKIDG